MELRVQIHLHTTESKSTRVVTEGIIHPKQAIDILKKNKIDVAAITDHNTTRAYSKVKNYAEERGVLLINGIEIDTVDGHLIGLDVDEEIEKYLRRGLNALEASDLIKDCGGVVYIPHPFDIQRKGIERKVKETDGIIEVFNSLNIFRFEDKLANIAASKLGRPKAVGADAHTPDMITSGIMVVNAELETQSILQSIKNGNVQFENCKYITLKQIKEWTLQRMILSYTDLKDKLKNGWEVDKRHMIIANSRFLKPLGRAVLELGVRKPNSKIWDFVADFSYVLTGLYAKFIEREFDTFVSML